MIDFHLLLLQGFQMVLVLATAPLLVGIVRKTKARLTGRRGAPVYQPYRDLARLLRKEAVVADSASWLFHAVPYIVFSAIWVAAALVPMPPNAVPTSSPARARKKRAVPKRPTITMMSADHEKISPTA